MHSASLLTGPPGDSLAELLAWHGPGAVDEWLAELEALEGPQVVWAALCHWQFWGRSAQQFPAGDWLVWLMMAGRGWGKNRTASEWVHHKAWALPGSHGALVARTASDVRDTVALGVSGIVATAKPWNPCEFITSRRLLVWRNGTTAHTYSSEEPDQLRGPNHHWGLADEWATWLKKRAADGGTAWEHLRLGCRLAFRGQAPQLGVATTPRPTREMKALLKEPGVTITRGRTRDNSAHLDASYLDSMEAKHGGTRLGRQELEGELLEDVEDAVVSLDMIDEMRLEAAPANLHPCVVAVDPSGGTNEQGIVAAARADKCACGMGGPLPHFLVLADKSGRYKPEGWGSAACSLLEALDGDRIIGERNYGGDMVESTLRQCDPDVAYRDVSASRGKAVRAQPTLALYEQRRVHHVGSMPRLEDEICRFTSERYEGTESPNRADALVWALADLSPRTRRRRFRVWRA